jgi:1-acyl-sn-glycerol-3-phosphate acyltransferase
MKIRNAGRLVDVAVTMTCWCYFILGFLLFFSPFYVVVLFSSRSEYLFQRLNNIFFRGFFALLKHIAPRQQWSIDQGVTGIRSSVVVCNHLSYLDPLLLVSLLRQAKTIVKPVFFAVPVFGWILRKSGYFPAKSTGRFARIMLEQMETMGKYLSDGGNLFIFPQGTRSRDGNIGSLNQGAFKIARYCKVPVYVLCIRNTEKLFTPRKFFFFAGRPNHISVSIIDRIPPGSPYLSLSELNARIRRDMESCMHGEARESRAGE